MARQKYSQQAILAAHCARSCSEPCGAIAIRVERLFKLQSSLWILYARAMNDRELSLREERRAKTIREHAREEARALGINIRFNSDARGASIKVRDVDSGNDMGGTFPCCE